MVVVVVVLLGFAVATAVGLALVSRRRLAAQRALAQAAEERSTMLAEQVATESAAVVAAAGERDTAAALAAQHAELARLAGERAAASEVEARAATEAARVAEEGLAAAQSAMAASRDAAPAASVGLDADVVWILEQARSERTWRFSVAAGAESEPVLSGAANPLMAALQIELDAAREDVGAVVGLDAEIPDGLTVAATVLTLRAAQELVADIVRRSEETTLRVRADGGDLVVDVHSVDEHGAAVLPHPLPIPPSRSAEVTATGVRIHGAFVADPAGA